VRHRLHRPVVEPPLLEPSVEAMEEDEMEYDILMGDP
jgi:hypothetical protein